MTYRLSITKRCNARNISTVQGANHRVYYCPREQNTPMFLCYDERSSGRMAMGSESLEEFGELSCSDRFTRGCRISSAVIFGTGCDVISRRRNIWPSNCNILVSWTSIGRFIGILNKIARFLSAYTVSFETTMLNQPFPVCRLLNIINVRSLVVDIHRLTSWNATEFSMLLNNCLESYDA